jgi:hypothetical protein
MFYIEIPALRGNVSGRVQFAGPLKVRYEQLLMENNIHREVPHYKALINDLRNNYNPEL